jgi:Na+/melibiose symporter-like transporter
MAHERYSGWRLAAFSTPSLPLAAMLLPVTIYLPNYYTEDLGVGLVAVGWAFGLVRLFDLWSDPVLGLMMDRTRTRFGRFRPWFVAGAPIAMIAIWMLFMARPGIGAIYILLWLIAGFLGQSMTQLGHMAWASQATRAYDERSRIYGWSQGFTVLGMLVILILPVVMSKVFKASDTQGVQAMGWFVILALPPAVVLALLAVPEPLARLETQRLRLAHYWRMFRQPNALRLLAVDILLGTGPGLAGTLFFFYFGAVRGYDRGDAGALLILYFLGALAGAPLWTLAARRFGKHRTLAAAAVLYAVAQSAVLITPHGLVWGIVTMFLAGLPFSAGPILLKAMMADVGDEVRLRTGIDQSGLLFSLLTGSIKIGSATAVIVSTQVLSAFGYQPALRENNSPEALMALGLIFGLVPAALGLIAAALIWFHRLDASAHGVIRRELDERDALEDIANRLPGGPS